MKNTLKSFKNKKVVLPCLIVWLINNLIFAIDISILISLSLDLWYVTLIIHLSVDLFIMIFEFCLFERKNTKIFTKIFMDFRMNVLHKKLPMLIKIKYWFLPWLCFDNLITAKIYLADDKYKIFSTRTDTGIILFKTCTSILFAPLFYFLKLKSLKAWDKDVKHNFNIKRAEEK